MIPLSLPKNAPEGAALFCSFSGGSDSLALLLLLQEQFPNVEAVHFEHGIRGEDSLADAAFCQKFCAEKQIPCRVIPLHVPERRRKNEAPEEAARRLRLEAWDVLQKELGKPLIAVLAHHADDRIETLLLRLLRGAGSSGLAAPRELTRLGNVCLWRPLLDRTKQELQAFLLERGIRCWRTDRTNAENFCRRNWIRNELLPLLERHAPGCREGLNRSAEALLDDAEALEETAAKVWEEWRQTKTVRLWECQPDAVLARLLRRLLPEKNPPSRNLIRRFSGQLRSGKHGVIPVTDHLFLCLGKHGPFLEDDLPAETVIWAWENTSVIRFGDQTLSLETGNGDVMETDGEQEAVFPAEEFPETLLLRTCVPGESILPFGGTQEVSLKKLFSAAGLISLQKRKRVLVCDASGKILWIPGVRRSACLPVRDASLPVVRLRWAQSEERA